MGTTSSAVSTGTTVSVTQRGGRDLGERGAIGTTGVVSAANSLVGSSADDNVGSNIVSLTNGNYVVGSPVWNNGSATLGAVTWGSGTTGITGPISAANSLVGTTAADYIIDSSILALADGTTSLTAPGGKTDPFILAGAVTWGRGTVQGSRDPASAADSRIRNDLVCRTSELRSQITSMATFLSPFVTVVHRSGRVAVGRVLPDLADRLSPLRHRSGCGRAGRRTPRVQPGSVGSRNAHTIPGFTQRGSRGRGRFQRRWHSRLGGRNRAWVHRRGESL